MVILSYTMSYALLTKANFQLIPSSCKKCLVWEPHAELNGRWAGCFCGKSIAKFSTNTSKMATGGASCADWFGSALWNTSCSFKLRWTVMSCWSCWTYAVGLQSSAQLPRCWVVMVVPAMAPIQVMVSSWLHPTSCTWFNTCWPESEVCWAAGHWNTWKKLYCHVMYKYIYI